MTLSKERKSRRDVPHASRPKDAPDTCLNQRLLAIDNLSDVWPDAFFFEALEITEITQWFEWMNNHVPFAQLELPRDEETAVLVVAKVVSLVDRLEPLYGSLPSPLRSLFMQSLIFHQCWIHRKNQERARHFELPGGTGPLWKALEEFEQGRCE